MTKVTAGITISLDGYVTGPHDGPGRGLGDGGERLHHWVFGGPWTYQSERSSGPTGVDKQFFDAWMTNVGAVIGGHTTYWAAEAWGGQNPFGVPFFIVTHHLEDESATGGFHFVGSLGQALEQARAAAGERGVTIMGGADVIRQALRAGVVDELAITLAPVVLGAGKALFAGFDAPLRLEPIQVMQSSLATHVIYRVVR